MLKPKQKLTKKDEAQEVLESKGWNELLKPMIEKLINDLNSVQTINATSSRKADIEVLGRLYAIKSLQMIERTLQGMVDSGTEVEHLEKEEE